MAEFVTIKDELRNRLCETFNTLNLHFVDEVINVSLKDFYLSVYDKLSKEYKIDDNRLIDTIEPDIRIWKQQMLPMNEVNEEVVSTTIQTPISVNEAVNNITTEMDSVCITEQSTPIVTGGGSTTPKQYHNRQFKHWNPSTQQLLRKIYNEVFGNNIVSLTGRHSTMPVEKIEGIEFNRQLVCDRFERERNHNLDPYTIYHPLRKEHLVILKQKNWEDVFEINEDIIHPDIRIWKEQMLPRNQNQLNETEIPIDVNETTNETTIEPQISIDETDTSLSENFDTVSITKNNRPFGSWHPSNQLLLRRIYNEIFGGKIMSLTGRHNARSIQGRHNAIPVIAEKGIDANKKEVCDRFEEERDKTLDRDKIFNRITKSLITDLQKSNWHDVFYSTDANGLFLIDENGEKVYV